MGRRVVVSRWGAPISDWRHSRRRFFDASWETDGRTPAAHAHHQQSREWHGIPMTLTARWPRGATPRTNSCNCGYDNYKRLTQVTRPDGQDTYTYDTAAGAVNAYGRVAA